MTRVNRSQPKANDGYGKNTGGGESRIISLTLVQLIFGLFIAAQVARRRLSCTGHLHAMPHRVVDRGGVGRGRLRSGHRSVYVLRRTPN